MSDDLSTVTTQRLVLKTPDAEDATAVTALMTPEVSRWLASWPPRVDHGEAMRRIADARQAVQAGQALHWIICEQTTARPIGWIRIARTERDPARGELGFWLGTGFQGFGYAAEAVQAAICRGFEVLHLNSIEGGAQPNNASSLRVMERVGMRPTGERVVWATARARHELCLFYEVARDSAAANASGRSRDSFSNPSPAE